MPAKLVALILLIFHLSITETIVNVYREKRFRTNDEKKLEHRSKIRHDNESQVRPLDVRDIQHRFVDGDWSNSVKRVRKVTALVAGVRTTTDSSLFDYFDEGEDEDKGDNDDDDNDNDEDDDEDDNDDDQEDDENNDKKKTRPFLRGGRRKYVRAHKIIFPLLLAYKLKFFTMLPLLVGSLVLLVATTGLAGFFFALFSAALGLHVKGRH